MANELLCSPVYSSLCYIVPPASQTLILSHVIERFKIWFNPYLNMVQSIFNLVNWDWISIDSTGIAQCCCLLETFQYEYEWSPMLLHA